MTLVSSRIKPKFLNNNFSPIPSISNIPKKVFKDNLRPSRPSSSVLKEDKVNFSTRP